MPASPSLLIVPARFKTGKLYTQIATTSAGVVLGSSGDFNVTRATTATRFNSAGLIESVASGVPRLDYYTSGGTAGCPALLVEPSAQNVLLQSEAFNTTWTIAGLNAFGSGSVANSTGTTDPFGGTNSDYIQETAASGTHIISQTPAGQVSGTTYTLSCFVKSAERTRVNLLNNAGGAGNVNFDLTAGTFNLISGVSAKIENYGNGWYRCILTYTPNATGLFNTIIRLADASGNVSYTGTGTSGLYVFGAQLEVGSVATSYIPTTAAAVTRNADVVSLSGAVSGCIGQTEGTIYAEVNLSNLTTGKAIMQIDDGTTTNRIACFVNTNPNRFEALVAGGGVATVLSGSITTGTHKASFSYSSGSVQVYLDGAFLTSGTPTNFPTVALTNIAIGSRISAGVYGAHLTDRIRAAALYTTRLTNAELAALTTL
jgi:hypothetical protein